ncbi:PadR family transcriptional regulator [Candidatus Latescibacterota bacterium]
MNIKKELAGAATSMIILSVLAREPNYGYEIVKRANESSGDVFTWQEGTVYPVLRKLEKEGLLTSDWQEAGASRKRKYYFITTAGREALAAGRKEWKGFYQLITHTMEASNAF